MFCRNWWRKRVSSHRAPSVSVMSDNSTAGDASRGPLILFGTQTGNAEAISKMLATGLDGIPHMPKARVLSMTDYTKQEKDVRLGEQDCSRRACMRRLVGRLADVFVFSLPLSHSWCVEQVCAGLLQETAVIILCSTTGNGDPPDNARPFIRQLRQKTDPSTLKGRSAGRLAGPRFVLDVADFLSAALACGWRSPLFVLGGGARFAAAVNHARNYSHLPPTPIRGLCAQEQQQHNARTHTYTHIHTTHQHHQASSTRCWASATPTTTSFARRPRSSTSACSTSAPVAVVVVVVVVVWPVL